MSHAVPRRSRTAVEHGVSCTIMCKRFAWMNIRRYLSGKIGIKASTAKQAIVTSTAELLYPTREGEMVEVNATI